MANNLKRAAPSRKGSGKTLTRTMKKTDPDGSQYIVGTPIDKSEYSTSDSTNLRGVANSPSDGAPGVTLDDLKRAMHIAGKRKQKQLDALPIGIYGSLIKK
jgi:hypothetical protein